ncbi:hypothetical protein AVEN_59773-1, partial [Araneus ventricosus]
DHVIAMGAMELEPARGAESSATEQRQEEQFQKTQFHSSTNPD